MSFLTKSIMSSLPLFCDKLYDYDFHPNFSTIQLDISKIHGSSTA